MVENSVWLDQVQLLLMLGFTCAMMTIFMVFMKMPSRKKKDALMFIETSAAFMLIFEALTQYYTGATFTGAVVIRHIGNFAGYLFALIMLFGFNEFILESYMESGHFKEISKRLKICRYLLAAGVVMLIIGRVTGLYYYYDEATNYHRGKLYLLAYLVPALVLVLHFTFIVQFRKYVTKELHISLLLFVLVQVWAPITQILFPGFSYINMCLGISAIELFILTIIDMNRVLMRAASTEFYTGLPNAYGFRNRLLELRRTRNITEYNAFYFDVLHMDYINEKYGRGTGDDAIKKYAEYIRVRMDDSEILGRVGETYFLALVKKINTESFLDILSGVTIEAKNYGVKREIRMSAVAGGYNIDDADVSDDRIFSKTTMAVAYAKNVTKKPVAFMDETTAKAIDELNEIQEDIDIALEDEEFVAYYQPKVDSVTRTLCGAEALVRWYRAGQIIPPGRFTPVMEKDGTVAQLDFYMLEHVCRDISEWLGKGLKVHTVSVNFSRDNLVREGIAERIRDTVAGFNVPAKYIQIEVLETGDEIPMKQLGSVIDALHEYGFTVAIDDFGTGGSSINLLTELNFDILKVDRCFVNYHSDKEKQVLEHMIQMAQAIGIGLIAEGVEEERQIEVLKQLGCTHIQGYYFDKPLDKETFEERLVRQKY